MKAKQSGYGLTLTASFLDELRLCENLPRYWEILEEWQRGRIALRALSPKE